MLTVKEKAALWDKFVSAMDECKVSVILENVESTIDGGHIVTEIDDVIEHITA